MNHMPKKHATEFMRAKHYMLLFFFSNDEAWYYCALSLCKEEMIPVVITFSIWVKESQ